LSILDKNTIKNTLGLIKLDITFNLMLGKLSQIHNCKTSTY